MFSDPTCVHLYLPRIILIWKENTLDINGKSTCRLPKIHLVNALDKRLLIGVLFNVVFLSPSPPSSSSLSRLLCITKPKTVELKNDDV